MQLQRLKGYEEMAESLLNELQTIEKDIDNRDRIVLLRLLQTIDNRITQIKYLNTLQQLIEEYTTIHDNIKKENEERRMKKLSFKTLC